MFKKIQNWFDKYAKYLIAVLVVFNLWQLIDGWPNFSTGRKVGELLWIALLVFLLVANINREKWDAWSKKLEKEAEQKMKVKKSKKGKK